MRTEVLENLYACHEAIQWAKTQPNKQAAWNACERGDWLLWILGKTCKPNSRQHKQLVLAACQCARLSLRWVPAGKNNPLIAIDTAELWARGEATVTQVKAAAYAAHATTYATTYATFAAHAAHATHATHVATFAAYAAYATDSKKLANKCADIVRAFFPKPPRPSTGGAAT
jgi:hypothetical protein